MDRPFFSLCYGLLSPLLVLLPIINGMPIPKTSDLLRRYDDGFTDFLPQEFTTGDGLDFTSIQGSSDLGLFGDYTGGPGDDTINLDGGLGDDLITLDGDLGDDTLNLDDGSFQLAGDFINRCKIWFRSGDCKEQDSTTPPTQQAPTPEATPGEEIIIPERDRTNDCHIVMPGKKCVPGSQPDVQVPSSDTPSPITPLDVVGAGLFGLGAAGFKAGEVFGTGAGLLLKLGNQ